jgi:hypothetical protein
LSNGNILDCGIAKGADGLNGVILSNDFNGYSDGITSNVLPLETANTNGKGITMYSGAYLIDSNVEISVPLTVLAGATFTVLTGVTLTISKGFSCGLHHCFTGDGNVIFKGGSVKEAPIQWFGAISNNNSKTFLNDCSYALEKALLCEAVVSIPAGYYYLARTITISKPCSINLVDAVYPPASNMYPPYDPNIDVERNNRSVIYTNMDIDFFIIESRNVWINGGMFDASNVLANTDNHAVFHYMPKGVSNVESYGMRQGGITNFLVIGSAENLIAGNFPINVGNGIIGIYIDWINAEFNSYLYRHKWQGWFENVKYGLYESIDGGLGASNSSWHEINFQIWVARQAVVLNRSTENDITITFQSAPILNASEKDLAIVEIKGSYGNHIKAKFVDLGVNYTDPSYSWSIYYLGYSHFYTFEDYTGRNFYTRTNSDVDINERNRKKVGGVINGITSVYADNMSGILPSGQTTGIYEGFRSAYYSNSLIAADKRYNVGVKYYEKPIGIDFVDIDMTSADYECVQTINIEGTYVENLWTAHSSFTNFVWKAAANETDYVEIVISGIEDDFIRFNELFIAGSAAVNSGFKQIQVIQIPIYPESYPVNSLGESIALNLLVDCTANIRGLDKYAIPLNDQVQTKKIIIRLIGLHVRTGDQAFYIDDFCLFKPFNGNTSNIAARSTAPLVAISGNQQIFGNMVVAGTTTLPADLTVGNGAWNGTGLLTLGIYRLWVDATGKLRIKDSVPTSDTDGTIVGV